MNIEKLGLLLFIKYVNQFEVVKGHLLASLKELLLALSSTLKLTDQMTQNHFLFRHVSPLSLTFQKLEELVEMSIDQIGTPDPKDLNSSQSPNQIISSIIDVIDLEIDQIEDQDDENKSLKIEALETVKNVLMTHHEEAQSSTLKPAIALTKKS